MTWTSCHYVLCGVECWRVSLRDAWRHFVSVVDALDGRTLASHWGSRDDLMGWAANDLNKKTLREWTELVIAKMGLCRDTFVVLYFDVEPPESARQPR